MDTDQRQIVLGTLLGNGYLCRNANGLVYLCIKHSAAHKDWLHTKAAELRVFQGKKPWYEYRNTRMWRTLSNQSFADLWELCYPNGKRTIRMEWLDQLRDLAIAVWYGDSGGLTGRGYRNACLRTQAFGREGNEVIARYFNEVGVPCNMNKSRDSWNIVFTVAGTQTLLTQLVSPHLPESRLAQVNRSSLDK